VAYALEDPKRRGYYISSTDLNYFDLLDQRDQKDEEQPVSASKMEEAPNAADTVDDQETNASANTGAEDGEISTGVKFKSKTSKKNDDAASDGSSALSDPPEVLDEPPRIRRGTAQPATTTTKPKAEKRRRDFRIDSDHQKRENKWRRTTAPPARTPTAPQQNHNQERLEQVKRWTLEAVRQIFKKRGFPRPMLEPKDVHDRLAGMNRDVHAQELFRALESLSSEDSIKVMYGQDGILSPSQ
jgi:hypothetical protein